MHITTNSLIYQTQDLQGVIQVVDDGDERTLMFDSTSLQSRMSKGKPNQLITPYEQVMAYWRLFVCAEVGEALILGLGGGSAAKYCLEKLPNWQIHVVELREKMVAIAQTYFALPKDDRLTIYIEDGAQFIAHQAKLAHTHYQLLLVDLFDLTNNYSYDYTETFLKDCLKCLSVHGVMAMNLWGTNEVAFTQIIAALGKVFEWKMLIIPVTNTGNVVVFAFHPQANCYEMVDLMCRQQMLIEDKTIDWQSCLERILQNNREQFSRIIHC
jgi:spermidine synthase